jgi:hypothetical protein
VSPTFTPIPPDPSVTIIGVYPNPIGADGAVLLIHVTYVSHLKMKVFDLRGELVFEDDDYQALKMGDNRVVWNPRNSSGKSLAFGAYYLHILAGAQGRSAEAGRWISVVR